MGVNICVVTEEGHEHPEWDFVRHAGDREIPGLLSRLPGGIKGVSNDVFDGEIYCPLDIEDFKNRLIEICPDNIARWETLATYLNDGYWIYVS